MIRIIAGVYGHKENGVITPKDSKSEPFSLTPEREVELVAQGVAEYANVIIPDDDQDDDGQNDDDQNGNGQNDDDQNGNGQNDDDQNGSGQNDDDQNGNGQNDDDQNDDAKTKKPEYSDKMKLPELQALAASFGLDAEKMRAKAEVIKLLDDYFADEDDGEQPPAFGAIDPVG